MKDDFDYTEVPTDYLHCLHVQCPRSARCLRYLITRHAGAEVREIALVNPAYALAYEDNCEYFHEDFMSCFAFGVTHLFDAIPYAQALRVKKMMYNRLKRNTYYRILQKNRVIKPDEVSLIRNIFKQEGIDYEPMFDELIYRYDWK